jgi:hypothetical protein
MSAKPTGQLKEEAPRRPSAGQARQAMIVGRDREFLPAALEILETPPAPGATLLMLTLCAFMATAIGWSYIGRLDVDAIAQGKLEARGRTKVIQPLESGKVRSIAVENGEAVKAGDLLIEFDTTELQADVRDHSDALAGSEAEQARRSAAIAAARKTDSAEGLAMATFLADESLAPAAFAREKAVFRADLDQLADSSNDIDKKMPASPENALPSPKPIALMTALGSVPKSTVTLPSLTPAGVAVVPYPAKIAAQPPPSISPFAVIWMVLSVVVIKASLVTLIARRSVEVMVLVLSVVILISPVL